MDLTGVPDSPREAAHTGASTTAQALAGGVEAAHVIAATATAALARIARTRAPLARLAHVAHAALHHSSGAAFTVGHVALVLAHPTLALGHAAASLGRRRARG